MVSQSGKYGLLGAISKKGAKGRTVSSKEATGKPWGHNFKLTLYCEFYGEDQKKVVGVFKGSSKTQKLLQDNFELMMKSKKKF